MQFTASEDATSAQGYAGSAVHLTGSLKQSRSLALKSRATPWSSSSSVAEALLLTCQSYMPSAFVIPFEIGCIRCSKRRYKFACSRATQSIYYALCWWKRIVPTISNKELILAEAS